MNSNSGVGPFSCMFCTSLISSSQANIVTHSNSTSIKMAVYKPQINEQLVVVVLASAALIINPITFHSAPVKKGKAIRGWLSCLGNRNTCSTPPRERGLPRCLSAPRPFSFLGVYCSLERPYPLHLALYYISLYHILSATSERCAH